MNSESPTEIPNNQKSYYEILGVSPDATSEQITKAYLSLAKKYHPDVDGTQVDENMVELNRIYGILSNPDKRLEYNNRFTPLVHRDLRNVKRYTVRTPPKSAKGHIITGDTTSRFHLTKIRTALTIFVIVLMLYLAFYLIVKILQMYIDLPEILNKIFPGTA